MIPDSEYIVTSPSHRVLADGLFPILIYYIVTTPAALVVVIAVLIGTAWLAICSIAGSWLFIYLTSFLPANWASQLIAISIVWVIVYLTSKLLGRVIETVTTVSQHNAILDYYARYAPTESNVIGQ